MPKKKAGKTPPVKGLQRGKKYTGEVKERAMALLAVEPDLSLASKQLNIPRTTLHDWKVNLIVEKEDGALDGLRTKRKEEFVNAAWSIIDDSLKLLQNRIRRALDKENELDELLEEIRRKPGDELSSPAKEAAIAKVRSMQLQQVREVSALIGTLYDKQALATGGTTANIGVGLSESDRSLLEKVERMLSGCAD